MIMILQNSPNQIETLEKLTDDLNPHLAYEILRAIESIMVIVIAYERSAFYCGCPALTRSNWSESETLANSLTELKNKYGPPNYQI